MTTEQVLTGTGIHALLVNPGSAGKKIFIYLQKKYTLEF